MYLCRSLSLLSPKGFVNVTSWVPYAPKVVICPRYSVIFPQPLSALLADKWE